MPISPEHEALAVMVEAMRKVIEQSKPFIPRDIEADLEADLERRHAGDRRFP